jgi:hypothetical protein
MNKKIEQEPIQILEIDLKQLRQLVQNVDQFISGFDEHRCDDDSVLIRLMSNGKIKIGGDFKFYTDADISV